MFLWVRNFNWFMPPFSTFTFIIVIILCVIFNNNCMITNSRIINSFILSRFLNVTLILLENLLIVKIKLARMFIQIWFIIFSFHVDCFIVCLWPLNTIILPTIPLILNFIFLFNLWLQHKYKQLSEIVFFCKQFILSIMCFQYNSMLVIFWMFIFKGIFMFI